MHEARIESPVPEKQGHVVVLWDINDKTETVDLKDVTPMFQQRKRIKQAPTIYLSKKRHTNLSNFLQQKRILQNIPHP